MAFLPRDQTVMARVTQLLGYIQRWEKNGEIPYSTFVWIWAASRG